MRVRLAATVMVVALSPGVAATAAAGGSRAPGKPAIVSIAAAPGTVNAAGGSVVVRVRVLRARRCLFEAQHVALGTLAAVRTLGCSAGHASVRVAIGANPYRRAVALRVRVTAVDGAGRKASSTTTVVEAAAAAEAPSPAPAPQLAIETSTLPSATAGVPYLVPLAAAGGLDPYTWTLAAGALPAGLTLSPTGTIGGNPAAAGQASFTVAVADATGRSATVALSLTVSASQPSVPAYESTNWSGYVLEGGPFTAVTGTFDVPAISPSPSDTSTSEWVGLDGAEPTDPQIIQAGIGEDYSATTSSYDTYAWIELFPQPASYVPIPVTPGNEVTVTISAVSTGVWSVLVKNDTTGQTYSVDTAYSGPATSAEWIVEAPTSSLTSSVYTVGTFSPVTFTQLGVDPSAGALARLVMVQGGSTVSVPSSLTANGFTVAYGAVTPNGP